ncbi:MAG TPA: AAC(3) family N-acetyltransferase [Pyrinomonadaceae bacterium]|nr:AAC(3) family N-acetyltransferase [Pyrinomonadaceae bacterium]
MTLTTSRITEGVVRRFKRARRKLVRLNEAKIREALESCGAFKSDLLLVHSSLSACGSIDGGPETVVNALRSWITDRAALALPTHTWSYPDASGVAPVYDFRATPSVVGTITNYYWRQPGIVRSQHPSHSIAISGPGAEDLCRDHELRETPCGPGTPYLSIAEGNSSVLMFGATMDAYTLYHTAEDAAEVPYLYLPEQVTLRTRGADDVVREVEMWRQDMSVARRFAATADWLVEQGLLIRRRLGLGELLFIPSARALHERMVETMRRDPLFLVDEKARPEVLRRMKSN